MSKRPVAGATGERLADRLADFLARVTPDGRFLFVPPAGLAWLGAPEPPQAQADHDLFQHIGIDYHDALRAALVRTADGGTRQALSLRFQSGDGGQRRVTCRILPLPGAAGRTELLFAAWEFDPLLDRAEGGAGSRDPLTGLADRGELMRMLGHAIGQTGDAGGGFALLLVGLDGFKKINDALGHALGDQILCESARRLRTALRGDDIVARIGGDEFALLLPGMRTAEDASTLAHKLLAAMQRPFEHGRGQSHLSASVGIALFPEHAPDAEVLLKQAGIALSLAKQAGRNRCHVYAPEGGALAERRLMLEERMYDAVRNGEFEMHYQPIVSAATGAVVAVEALMRWHPADGGAVSPAEFIPLAEANGLIAFLGAWSLRASCHQVARWNQRWQARLQASVNLSPAQFRQGDLVGVVERALAESGLPAELLTLELTEGMLMREPERAQELLSRLRERGVNFAVDDFGTGYSSLAYLKRFPLSSLKIDRSFVVDLASDGNDRAIVAAILSLARELGLRVVAEGVENETQYALLRDKGCELMQGYLLGRPEAPQTFEDRVEAGAWRLAP